MRPSVLERISTVAQVVGRRPNLLRLPLAPLRAAADRVPVVRHSGVAADPDDPRPGVHDRHRLDVESVHALWLGRGFGQWAKKN